MLLLENEEAKSIVENFFFIILSVQGRQCKH